MFEAEILGILQSDIELTSIVSTYAGAPAIFSNDAPQEAELPFVVFRIDGNSRIDAIQNFSIWIDYFDFYNSRVNARTAMRRIQYDLDGKRLQPTNYTDIRIWLNSGPTWITATEDVRDVHFNLQFIVRATITTDIYET